MLRLSGYSLAAIARGSLLVALTFLCLTKAYSRSCSPFQEP
ncbi:Uncharacterised protein [Vibrio cholerae]|nr:Uncharacterised protein [Vibrio cholerae]